MKILILNNHARHNVGDTAILEAIIASLRAAYGDATIAVTMNDADRALLPGGVCYLPSFVDWALHIGSDGEWRWRKAYVPFLMLWLLAVAALFGATGLRGMPRRPQRRRLMQAYYDADLVVVFGGGHLFAHSAVSVSFAMLWTGLALAVLMRKPLLFMPQSFGPLPGRPQRAMLRWLVEQGAFVAAREFHSLELLAQAGVKRRVLVLPDMAFATGVAGDATLAACLPELLSLLQTGRPIVGFSLMDLRAQNPRFRNQDRYEEAIIALMRHLDERYGAAIAVFAQVTGPTAGQDDRIIARRITARLAQHGIPALLVDAVLPYDVLAAAYARLESVVATRMHTAIFALSSGVPALAIGYVHKSIGIMETLGLARYCVDIAAVDADELLRVFDELWADRAAVRRSMAARIPAMRRTLEQLPGLLPGTSGRVDEGLTAGR